MLDMSSKSAFLWLSCSQLLIPPEALCIPFLEPGPAVFEIPAVLSHPLQLFAPGFEMFEISTLNISDAIQPCYEKLPDKALSWKQIKSSGSHRKTSAKENQILNKTGRGSYCQTSFELQVWNRGTAWVLVQDWVVARISYTVAGNACFFGNSSLAAAKPWVAVYLVWRCWGEDMKGAEKLSLR